MTPDSILLDLNMPCMDGRELLELIKSDDKLKVIPIIIMTTSRDERDIQKSYETQANCYIRKPLYVTGMFEVVRSIEEFWFNSVVLPTRID